MFVSGRNVFPQVIIIIFYVINISVIVITYVIPVLLLWFSSPDDFLDQMSPLPTDLEKPDCTKILDLPYSIHAFQHLRVSVLSSILTHIFLSHVPSLSLSLWFLSKGVQEKVNLTSPLLSKDDPIFASLPLKLGQSMDEVGHQIHQALLKVS